ncbi:MAG TPA: YegP family protein [Streptosporangiaceae bacterium]|nr:YegP family protein [Streptosporangiaceae bacterium]
MTGKFVLIRSSNGKFHFNLQAGNGEIIATSQQYETRASAEKGIESVRANAAGAVLDDQTEQTPKSAAPKPAASKPAVPKPAPPRSQTAAKA